MNVIKVALCICNFRLYVSPHTTEENRKMTPQEWLHQGLHDDKDVPILNNVRKSLVKMLEDVKDISTKYCKKSELISGALNESFKKNGHVVKCFLFFFCREVFC